MNFRNYSSSLSSSSKNSKGNEPLVYRARASSSSDEMRHSSEELEDFTQKKERNALDQVDEDNAQNFQLLSNFLKRQDQFNSQELSDALGKHSPVLSSSVIVSSVVAWIFIGCSICFSKYVYNQNKLTVWEDMYGRTLVGSVMSYVAMTITDTSPFDISTDVRNRLFMMQTGFIIAFGLIMVAAQYLSSLTVIASLLLFYIFSEKILGINLVFIGIAICGMIILANPFGIFVEGADQIIPISLTAVALLLMVFSRVQCSHIKHSLPLSTGTFLFNFSTLLVVPSFMIVAFSVESSHVDYGTFEISYFLVNGVITWFGLYLIIQTFKIDKMHLLEVVGYSGLVYALIYQVVYNHLNASTQDNTLTPSPTDVSGTNSTDTNTNSTSTEPTSENSGFLPVPTLGIWEYIGIAVMVGPRFGYSIYKLVNYIKAKPVLD